ncbi:hypothetical protein HPB52_016187 [Rhipicephalus sanguineus]|uniref:Uncharacterized protein n=1 Tax=Rhipicephalus sanguineus TaxID=34632 RepID=A0A9D4YQB6_RHISA|nr:hypothetical protein HPB52_016187 [Rhipicephalus sanguineus]
MMKKIVVIIPPGKKNARAYSKINTIALGMATFEVSAFRAGPNNTRGVSDQKLCLDHRLVNEAQSLHPTLRTPVLASAYAAHAGTSGARTGPAHQKALLDNDRHRFRSRVLLSLLETVKWQGNQRCWPLSVRPDGQRHNGARCEQGAQKRR